MRIVIVDSDAENATSLLRVLTRAGHKVVRAASGPSFLRLMKSETFDLVLLDWSASLDGVDIVGKLRSDVGCDVPVILLTSNADADAVVSGLSAGADDHIAKPVDDRILLARIDAIARRRGAPRAELLPSFAEYRFDPATEIVRIGDRPVRLTAKEYQLALVLFRNLSRPLSRAYLLETVWNRNPDVQTRTLDSHVARLRGKLELRPEKGWRLSPIYSYGYRLENITVGAEAPRNAA